MPHVPLDLVAVAAYRLGLAAGALLQAGMPTQAQACTDLANELNEHVRANGASPNAGDGHVNASQGGAVRPATPQPLRTDNGGQYARHE